MNYRELLIKYIDSVKNDEPIFVSDIKSYLMKKLGREKYKIILNRIYPCIERLIKRGVIRTYSSGIYYKGNITLDKIIERKYIRREEDIFGYRIGDMVVSNVCKKGSMYYNKTLGVKIKKPRMSINSRNYKYLRLLDMLYYGYNIDVEEYMNNNNLNINELSWYAKVTRNKKAFSKLKLKIYT